MGTVTRLLPQGSLGLGRVPSDEHPAGAPSHTPQGSHSLAGGSPAPAHAHEDLWSISHVPHPGKLRQGVGLPPPGHMQLLVQGRCCGTQMSKLTPTFFSLPPAHHERLQCSPNHRPWRFRGGLRLPESRYGQNVIGDALSRGAGEIRLRSGGTGALVVVPRAAAVVLP